MERPMTTIKIDPENWSRTRNERRLQGLSSEEAAQEIGISPSALSRAEKHLPLEPADRTKLQRWLGDIGRARLARLAKLRELAETAAALPQGLAEAALVSLAENASDVFEACGAEDLRRRGPLDDWAESVSLAWERGGGLRRAEKDSDGHRLPPQTKETD